MQSLWIFLRHSIAYNTNIYEPKSVTFNLTKKTTQWIAEFLCNEHQSVKFNNIISRKSPIKSGVPRGSVLGPLLLLVYINDIGSNVASSIRLFADDCVVYKEITEPTDVSTLQSDLTKLVEWCRLWQMEINIEKNQTHQIFFRYNPPSSHICS